MSSTQTLQRNSLSDFPLDIHFNAAVLTICSRVLPGGYDVSDEAPETYEELIAHLDAGRRMLVYSGGSERTIYGDPEVNFAFRAWHDWCHWRGRHDFSMKGERAACAMQGEHLVTLYGESPQTRVWRRILQAEIIGQRDYFDRHGTFPVDQRAFVAAYLAGHPARKCRSRAYDDRRADRPREGTYCAARRVRPASE